MGVYQTTVNDSVTEGTEIGDDSVKLALVINTTSMVWLSTTEQCFTQTASLSGPTSVTPSPSANNTALVFDPNEPGKLIYIGYILPKYVHTCKCTRTA